MSREKLRVGIIGAGRWSSRAHIPGWVRSDLIRVLSSSEAKAYEGKSGSSGGKTLNQIEAELNRRQIISIFPESS